ncbi:hypothetical protein BGX20_011361, partial [Mortierella sp. AD010]
MAISPDESIIALAGVDGSIRTFFAKSGIEINPANHVRFINSKIEYLGFLGRNDRMLAIVHNNTNHKLESRVLDPLDFRFRIKYSPVPIPTAGITLLLAARNASSTSNGQGMVCAADGKFLRFYSTQEIPLDPPVDLSAKPSDKHADKKLEEISATVDSENREYGDAGFQENGELIYSLHISAEAKPLENGDGKDYLALHVSVLQKTKSSDFDTKVLFDFVPEPWLRCPTSMQNKPDQLLTVYFLPCKKRFVIIGYQSIQIWALPSKKYPMVRLLAFWSKPRDFKSLLKEPLSYSEIYDKFHTIDDAWVFETHSDVTQLTVRLFNGTDEKVILPGLSRSHHGALDCHRSIYLLAASYSFASENESYEAHASALVRFAVRYINRITTLGDILGDAKSNVDEHESGDSKPRFESPTPKEHDVELPEIEESDRVDMLRLLIHNIGFQHTSNPFTKAILLTGDWIPREDLTWNPIQQAIEVENHEIVNDLVNSCIDNAKTRHPAYLTLTIGVLDKLKTRYPSLTSKIFSEASYIKVKNKAYISTNAIVAKPPYQLWKSKSTHWSEYDNPVFCIQTQLPFQTIKPKSFIDRLLESIMQPERTKSFPENQGESNTLGNKKTQQSLHTSNERCYDIYVVPFSKLSTYSASGKDISKFTEIAVILLMNVLIAIMNDGYSESRDEGQSTWLKQWSEVIVDAELFMMRRSTRQNKYFFPDYIYYAARPQDVEDYERKEAAKRLLEYQTSDVIMSSITKDKSKKKIMSVHQDVKYVLENQLKIERLMKTLHSISDPNSGHRRDGVFGTPHQHETAAQGHSVTKVDHITSASTVEQPTTEHPITHEPGANKGASSVQDLDNVSTPVVPTGSSWFRRKIRQTEAAAREIKNAASNAIHDRIGQISRHNTPTHVINVAHIEDETNNDVEDVEETVKETEVKGGEAFEPAMPTYIAAIDKPSVDELCPVRKTSQ